MPDPPPLGPPQAPPPPPQWSSDGQWWWNGIEWVHRSQAARRSRTVFGIPLGIVVAVVIYLVVHWVVYGHCVFPPGIFEWPSACL